MIFGFPAGFWLLGLIPVIIVAHLLHQRRHRQRVSSLLLWGKLQGSQSRRPRWRELLNLHFLLQCLAILMAAFALAEPMLPRSLPPGQERQIIVADTSASMGALTDRGERISLLREALRRHLETSPGEAEVTLIELSRAPRVRGTFLAGDRALLDVVETLEATDEEGDPAAALKQALRLAGGREGSEVHLFTDGAYTLEPGLLETPAMQTHLLPGTPRENAGITAFAAGKGELFLALEYQGSAPARRTLHLLTDDYLFIEQELELLPGERQGVTFPLPVSDVKRIRALLLEADGLAADDAAYGVIDRERSLDVALVGPGNPFLRAALTVHPRVRLGEYTQFTPAIDADIFVFDRLGEVALPRGRVLAFATDLPGFPAQRVGQRSDVTSPVADPNHPVTRGLNLSRSYIAETASYNLPPEVASLITHEEQSIAFAGEVRGVRLVSFGFDLTSTDLPLQPALPLLIEHTLDWLTAGSYPLDNRSYSAGETVSLELLPGRSATLLRPDGGSFTIEVNSLSQPFTATRDAGVYTIRQEGRERAFAVNLLSPVESDLTPRLEVPKESTVTAAPLISGTRNIWRILALAALLLAVADALIPGRRR